jgi:hypothetical protein
MDIFLQEPGNAPLPPDEVRLRSLLAEPWPDGQRVRISVEVDPFQQRPNIDLAILDADEHEIATASIVETMVRKLHITMHLRTALPGQTCMLKATLFYTEDMEIPEGEELPQPRIKIVDHAQTSFNLPSSSPTPPTP